MKTNHFNYSPHWLLMKTGMVSCTFASYSWCLHYWKELKMSDLNFLSVFSAVTQSADWLTVCWWFCADTIYVVCFSLIMLSVDLTSPHIKNKMSKREFIRNTRRAVAGINDEFAGHLYDNVYLVGHVAPKPRAWCRWLVNGNIC